MNGERASVLLSTMQLVERLTLAPALAGLTDAELHGEPVPDSWGVRPHGSARTPTPFRSGAWDVDVDVDATLAMADRPGAGTTPLPTIAWLLWHVGSQPARLVETEVLGGPHPPRDLRRLSAGG